MTADEWDTSNDWRAKVLQLPHADGSRRLRLLAVSVCRHILDCHTRVPIARGKAGNWFTRLSGPAANLCDVAEQFADGHATPTQLSAAFPLSGGPHHILNLPGWLDKLTVGVVGITVGNFAQEFGVPTTDELISLLRDIFGNPFRPVVFDPRWRSESSVALARTAYDTRNFSLLPILADALEEAGCDHPDMLAHCRQPDAVHVRGCWVVDLVLNKS